MCGLNRFSCTLLDRHHVVPDTHYVKYRKQLHGSFSRCLRCGQTDKVWMWPFITQSRSSWWLRYCCLGYRLVSCGRTLCWGLTVTWCFECFYFISNAVFSVSSFANVSLHLSLSFVSGMPLYQSSTTANLFSFLLLLTKLFLVPPFPPPLSSALVMGARNDSCSFTGTRLSLCILLFPSHFT